MKTILSKLRTPIGENLISTFFGIGIQLFVQLILVPFYLIYWGVELYGDWIVLTAITSFFSISDIGLNTVASNLLAIRYQEKQYKECNSLLANSVVLLIVTFSILNILLFIFLLENDLVAIAGLNQINRFQSSVVLILLVVKIFFGMMGGVYHSIYKCVSKTHKGIMISNISRLIEGLILLLCIIVKLPILLVALLYIVPSIITFIYIRYDTTHNIYKFKFHISYLNWRLFKSLLIPSFAFISFPFGLSILNQGFTLIVNKYLGAESVVLFNTTRTLTNFAKSIVGNIQVAIWPEFTIAYANNNKKRMQNIARKVFHVSIFLTICFSLFFYIFGEWIYDIWTKGKVEFSMSLMMAFLIVVFADSIWSTARLTLNATNNHTKIGLLYFCLSIIATFVAFLSAILTHKLILVVLSMLVVDIFMSVYSIKKSMLLTQDSFVNYLYYKK